MPLIQSSYRAPLLLRNKHVNTLYGSLLPARDRLAWTRERIETPDDDFLDLDWSTSGSTRLLLISHGMEGSSKSNHVLSLAGAASERGWDVLAWNFRGCSGEPNRTLRLYHSGATEDLDLVVSHAAQRYGSIALVGFSLGANLTLKFVGEDPKRRATPVKAVATIAAPCDLALCAKKLAEPENRVYMRFFLSCLKDKLALKQKLFPRDLSLEGFEQIRSFLEYDERYTAPLHGFQSAADYYARCSSKSFLNSIDVPTLILNAKDDPFLHPDSHPQEVALQHPYIWLELPETGGHVSFGEVSVFRPRWLNQRVLDFLERALSGLHEKGPTEAMGSERRDIYDSAIDLGV